MAGGGEEEVESDVFFSFLEVNQEDSSLFPAVSVSDRAGESAVRWSGERSQSWDV